ncbi:MAG: hypothetical protein EWM73_00007 [Nitrospira sp.]|nr:MAG: hypothetical protein EWM73_00007 [Nitrospira sp.]
MEAEPAYTLATKEGGAQRSPSLFRYRDSLEEIQRDG